MKSDIKDKVETLLSSVNLKRTQPRREILKVLLKANRPQTADEISEATGKARPNRVTVYRTLESLVEVGIVHLAFVNGRSRHYESADKCTKHQCHPHFVCTDCGQTRCLPEVSLPLASSAPAGFIINRQQVRLEGLCPKCVSKH